MVTQAIVPFRPRQELDLNTVGQIFAESGFFADSRQAAQAMTKILAGRELGVGPVAAMTGIYLVKGRITLSANLIATLIKRSGRYNYRVKRLDNDGCEIVFLEGGEVIGTSTFTSEDAATAQLKMGDNWKHYPRNMLFSRAMSNGAKWFCPELFAGPVYIPDELGVIVDPDTGQPETDPLTGEIIEAEVRPARGLTPQLRKALADWHEEATKARANGIELAPRDMDSATYEELRESSTRLLKLRQAAEKAGWPTLIADALELGLEADFIPEIGPPSRLKDAVEGLKVAVAGAQKARSEAGEEGPAPEALKAVAADDEEEEPVPF